MIVSYDLVEPNAPTLTNYIASSNPDYPTKLTCDFHDTLTSFAYRVADCVRELRQDWNFCMQTRCAMFCFSVSFSQVDF